MKRLIAVIAAGLMMMSISASAQTLPFTGQASGFTSENVEYVSTFVPVDGATSTGASFYKNGKDRLMVVTTWKNFSIYNVSDPATPELLSTVPFGFKFENEDVSTNGKIMLFSESLPQNILHVWDVEDPTNPVQIAEVPGAGQHTSDCILDCKWAYGSSGAITDLRDPANPVLMEEKWTDGLEGVGNYHDVVEVAPGLVLSASNPMVFLDARKNPVKPKLLAISERNEDVGEAPVHSNLWPRKAKDKFVLVAGESWSPSNGRAQCTEDANQGFSTWDASKWRKTHTFTQIDTWKGYNGTGTDGGSMVNAPFGCSSHWFDTHPKFKNGGLAAVAWYSNGTRILEVDKKGKIEEAGWFLPAAGGTSAAYWVDKEYIYAVDYQRGIDILRYTGKT